MVQEMDERFRVKPALQAGTRQRYTSFYGFLGMTRLELGSVVRRLRELPTHWTSCFSISRGSLQLFLFSWFNATMPQHLLTWINRSNIKYYPLQLRPTIRSGTKFASTQDAPRWLTGSSKLHRLFKSSSCGCDI